MNLRNYFRGILRDWKFLLIGTTGLSIALSSSFFILSHIIREFSYDSDFENGNRIFRIVTDKEDFGWAEPSCSYPLYQNIEKNVPGVESITILRQFRRIIINSKDGKAMSLPYAYATTESFFRIFTPEVLAGGLDGLLDDRNAIVLTESIAASVFGSADRSLGSRLAATIGSENITLKVTAVIKDFPETSSLRPGCLLSEDLIQLEYPSGSFFSDYKVHWTKDIFNSYLMIQENVKPEDVVATINSFTSSLPGGLKFRYELQPLKRIHLFSTGLANDSKRGDINSVMLFALVGILVLVIAVSNYVLLISGLSLRNTEGVAIRKVFGADGALLRRVAITESVMNIVIAIPLSVLLILAFRNRIESLFEIQLDLDLRGRLILFFSLTGLVVIAGVISGLYLSIISTKHSPVELLSIKGRGKRQPVFFKILVLLQIIIFSTLLSSSLLILRQIKFSREVSPGFNHSELIHLDFPSGLTTDYNVLKQQLLKQPGIKAITFGNTLPPSSGGAVTVIKTEKEQSQIRIEGISTDFDFFSTLDVDILSGRPFDVERGYDSTAYIINQTLADLLRYGDEEGQTHIGKHEIIGVCKDFRMHSTREDISPLTISIAPSKYISNALIRHTPGSHSAVIASVGKIMDSYSPSFYTLRSYYDQAGIMYGREIRTGSVVTLFGILAILLSLLGIFGFSLLLTDDRRFYTSILRVFGASRMDVVVKNTMVYTLYISAGTLISVPLVIILMNHWLQRFAEKISVGPDTFLLTCALGLVVFTSTTMINTIRLANLNPVENLSQRS